MSQTCRCRQPHRGTTAELEKGDKSHVQLTARRQCVHGTCHAYLQIGSHGLDSVGRRGARLGPCMRRRLRVRRPRLRRGLWSLGRPRLGLGLGILPTKPPHLPLTLSPSFQSLNNSRPGRPPHNSLGLGLSESERKRTSAQIPDAPPATYSPQNSAWIPAAL